MGRAGFSSDFGSLVQRLGLGVQGRDRLPHPVEFVCFRIVLSHGTGSCLQSQPFKGSASVSISSILGTPSA